MAQVSSGVPFLPTAASEDATLRASFVRDEDERPKGIDGGGARLAEIRDRVAAACKDWGIFQVVDHGVDAALVAEIAPCPRLLRTPGRGETPLRHVRREEGRLHRLQPPPGEAEQDWREIVTYFSYPLKARDYSRWPDKPVAWRAVVERYSEQLMGLACKLLGVLSEAMGLETEALAKVCMDMDQKVVVNFYPIEVPAAGPHAGAQAPSRCCCRTWLTVQPVEGAFVVNLGDHGHVQERGPPGGGELGVQPPVHRHVPEPITFSEMYRRKMARDIELARFKKQAKADKQLQQQSATEFAAPNAKSLEDILA
ncbi:unnamed protein product [Miscanthus lutarioriparius]|uniref:Non-haem dioxygenase N-terminal domain-containing protein n=1 Tax=Miscanthus lutarioriparius TaxID=422564 RepID=A0A811RRV4_9POAL|nr:unnamed protein product [Miscanthus lutarioriparius]